MDSQIIQILGRYPLHNITAKHKMMHVCSLILSHHERVEFTFHALYCHDCTTAAWVSYNQWVGPAAVHAQMNERQDYPYVQRRSYLSTSTDPQLCAVQSYSGQSDSTMFQCMYGGLTS